MNKHKKRKRLSKVCREFNLSKEEIQSILKRFWLGLPDLNYNNKLSHLQYYVVKYYTKISF